MTLQDLIMQAQAKLDKDIVISGAVLLRQKRSTAAINVINDIDTLELRKLIVNYLVEELENDTMLHSLDRLP